MCIRDRYHTGYRIALPLVTLVIGEGAARDDLNIRRIGIVAIVDISSEGDLNGLSLIHI